MDSRRVIAWGLAAVWCAAAAGCATQPKTESAKKVEQALPAGVAARGADASPGAGSVTTQPTITLEPQFNQAEALARKTAAYTQQVSPMLATRGGAPGAVTVTAQQAGYSAPADVHESRVEWGDPNELSLGSARGHSSRGPAAQPQTHRPLVKPAALEGSPATVNPPAPHSADVRPDDHSTAVPNAAETISAAAPVGDTKAYTANGSGPGGADAMEQKFEKRVREYPRDVSGHLDYQLLKFLLDERVPDLASISSLPTEDRELVAAVIDGLSNFRSTLRQDNNMLLSRKVHPLIEMADRLRSQADLTIPTIALCTTVRTYGQYDPIDPPRFAAAKAHDVILYCEIENLASQLDENRNWTSKLTKEAVLYTEGGTQVWSDKIETITDVSRHRRHDFFIVKKIRIPATLAVGRYLLKVSIVDQQVSRVAEATVPVVIAAQ